jgi:transketolase
VDGPVDFVTTIEPIADKWSAFGWTTFEVDGHDVVALRGALQQAVSSETPAIVVARTEIFGRMRSIQREADGHFIKLDAELERALVEELEEALDRA